MLIFRNSAISFLLFLLSVSVSTGNPFVSFETLACTGTEDDLIVHVDSGISIRNRQKGHYYKMIQWDQGQFTEFAWWKETELGAIVQFMNFRVAFPPGYNKADSGRFYPVILMLHGTAESGRKDDQKFEYDPSDPRYDNNSAQLLGAGEHHYKAIVRPESQTNAFPGILIFPQASYNGGWGEENVCIIGQFLEWMIRNYHLDQDRITVHGLSAGARGVWQIAGSRPDLIAAALPMSGVGTDFESQTKIVNTTPMWIFQGELDTNPSVSYSGMWYDELVKNGGTPKYTLYEGVGHGTWPLAYDEPDFFVWIRDQNKRKIHIMGGDLRENSCETPLTDPVDLGFSAGFLDYQWMRNGAAIPGANSRFYTVSETGIYSVQFKRRVDSTWDESYSLDMFYNDPNLPNYKPSLEAAGPTILPYYGLDRTLVLVADRKFTSYQWFKDDEPLDGILENELLLNDAQGQLFSPEDAGVYRVLAFDQNGCTTGLSDPVTITWDSSRVITNKRPLIYPNPFYDFFRIKLPDDSYLGQELVLYDQAGRLVLQEKIIHRIMQVDLSTLPAGIYLLKTGNKISRVIKAARYSD